MHDVTYTTFSWGPLLLKTHIGETVCNEILEIAKNSTLDSRANLASVIKNVKTLDTKDSNIIFEKLHSYFMCFLDTQRKYLQDNSTMPEQIQYGNMWINFQEAGEFNPPHRHSMDLSFIVCLDMPSEVIEENKSYTGLSSGPGAISFHYGEMDKIQLHSHQFLPLKGDMFLFPSTLRHTVFPFQSNATRITLSGNIGYIYNKENTQ